MALDVTKAPVSFQIFGGSGPNHSPGLVPDPGTVVGSTRYLCETGSFTVTPALPGTVTSSVAGLIPPFPNNTLTFFRGDGTYAQPPTVSASAAGYAPTFPNNTTTFLRGDGTYAAPTGTNRELLNSLNLASVTADTTSLTNAFYGYELVFEDVVPSNSAVAIGLQVHSGGAFKTSAYVCNSLCWQTTTSSESQSTTAIQIGGNTGGGIATVTPGLNGIVHVINPSNSNNAKWWSGQIGYISAANSPSGQLVNGCWNNAAAVDGFTITVSAGTLTGNLNVYGLI